MPATTAFRSGRARTVPPPVAIAAPFGDLDRLLSAIYDGPLETPPLQTAMEMLRQLLGALHVTLIMRPPSATNGGVMVHTGDITLERQRSYQTHFFAIDPFVRLPEGEVVTPEDFVGRPWQSSAVYRDYLQPIGIRHLIGADIYARDGVECRLRATRAADAPPFDAADRRLIRALLPHLQRSIRLHARLDFLECERALFAGTVNRLALGIISVDQDGRLVESNDEARRIVGEHDGLRFDGDSLHLDNAVERRQLQQMLQRCLQAAAGDGDGHIEAMSVTRPSGRRRLSVLIRAIAPGPFSESRQRPAAAIFVRDPELEITSSAFELARNLFAFTPMEASLALLLIAGCSLDEGAAQLNIRRNTARTHLQAIFGKTGVSRQAMLVRLLHHSVLGLA